MSSTLAPILTPVAVAKSDLIQFITSIVGHQDAEDVYQDVQIRLLETKFPYRPGDVTERTWTFEVAKNAALNHLRTERRHEARVEAITLESGSATHRSHEFGPELSWRLGRLNKRDRELVSAYLQTGTMTEAALAWNWNCVFSVTSFVAGSVSFVVVTASDSL